ncbi:TIR domain-containing protein [Rhizobium sp. WYCCWR 11290]|uniref:TIR domain-containing protein n=1 Tax=Rhizobium changzhiense TaxID=2692317 RepID=A0A7Z0UI73_9HYPH|nr:pYEATS domain-containing protein [Rhizobium changzhiense]NZD66260.1 TIR domain-containing protein [Rhizobium changzhiense]
MSYRIAQDFEYVGKDYWRWWSWIEGDGAELDIVKEVAWILHPSFKRTRIVATQRSNNFRLQTAGWGTFQLRAEVLLADGEKRLLKHNLRLEYPESSEANAPPRPTVSAPAPRPLTAFLSYSALDSRQAAKLREGFENLGIKILDQTRVVAGEPWSEGLQRMIAQSDAVVGLVSEDDISPWVSTEIQAAVSLGKPALVLAPAGVSTAGLPSDVRPLQVDLNRLDPLKIAELLYSLNRD